MSELLCAAGSDIYQRQITNSGNELMRTVWDGTPWIVDAFIGGHYEDGRREEIMAWCVTEFGPESWPIHGHFGNWHSGGACINGYQWIGFATKEMMQKFIDTWVST